MISSVRTIKHPLGSSGGQTQAETVTAFILHTVPILMAISVSFNSPSYEYCADTGCPVESALAGTPYSNPSMQAKGRYPRLR